MSPAGVGVGAGVDGEAGACVSGREGRDPAAGRGALTAGADARFAPGNVMGGVPDLGASLGAAAAEADPVGATGGDGISAASEAAAAPVVSLPALAVVSLGGRADAVGEAAVSMPAGARDSCDRAPIQTPAPPTASAPTPRSANSGALDDPPPGEVVPHDACVFACFDGGGTDPSGSRKLADEIPAA
jgi:hypothetical protein